ncbi:MAG: hypothetical protein WBA90_16890 [Albidovulum sp.]
MQILLVDISPTLMERVHELTGANFVVTTYRNLDASMITRVMPNVILAPLLGQDFDILDLTSKLTGLGYTGVLQAITQPLPNPDAVAREISSHCTGIDFSLVVLEANETI